MITFRPLTQWPRSDTVQRKTGDQFKASYDQTISKLLYEINVIRGQNVVLQTNHRERDIRMDGLPRKDAMEPSHPGVVASFDCPHGPLMFACDTYEKWIANLRAIALTLENLRAVERYGATKHGEQYTGYAALPASASHGFRSADEAAKFIMAAAGVNGDARNFFNDSADGRAAILRKAAANMHPDSGGSHDQFVKLQAAKALIEK